MNKENIKWIAIQPLTGGMYLGAEEAIGHPAEFILSFKGVNASKQEEDGTYSVAGNEFYLETYLKKKGRNVPRYDIQEGMFDKELFNSLNPTICDANGDHVDLSENYKDLDLVVAVPVCSGLSTASMKATEETRDSRNCNMKFITTYTLTKIRPKVYVFENAPTLMSERGKELVVYFKELAEKEGYSVLFYRTDTNLHHNCQRRVRTFVTFIRHQNEEGKPEKPFMFDWEKAPIGVKEYFAQMEPSELNNEPMWTLPFNWVILDYVEANYPNWKTDMKDNLLSQIIHDGKLDDLYEYAKSLGEDNEAAAHLVKYIDHINQKASMGLGYFAVDLCYFKQHFPAIQYRSLYRILHPTERRMCSVREALALMGHPADYEWVTGNDRKHTGKIGQNVPVKTAKFIVGNCVRALETWDEPRITEDCNNYCYQDNTKQKVVW